MRGRDALQCVSTATPTGFADVNRFHDIDVLNAKHFIVEMAKCFAYNTFMLFEIGDNIRKERKLRKLPQEKMARDLGMSRSTISQIESGTVQEIGVRKLMRILDYLGLELRVRPSGAPPTLDELREQK